MVLAFLTAAWLSLLVILVLAPETYDQALQVPSDLRVVFVVGLTLFIGLVAVGVLKRWGWAFWLLLAANLFGILRVPASALELWGLLPTTAPNWYIEFQAIVGAFQFAIGLVMLVDYRHHGIWGARTHRSARKSAEL
jgi:hypothetical protein